MVESVTLEIQRQRVSVRWGRSGSRADLIANVVPLRKLPGARMSKNRRDPHWTVPLDLPTLRTLRKAYGKRMVLGPNLQQWATEYVEEERQLGTLASATSAKLSTLPAANPELYEMIHVGPIGVHISKKKFAKRLKKKGSFQTADVKMMAEATAVLNANAPGSGKTFEIIAAVIEAGMDDGPQLVFAPKTALNTVWKRHLERLQPLKVLVATGNRARRQAVMTRAAKWAKKGKAFWLVCNPDMVGYVYDPTNESKDVILMDARLLRGKKPCRCSARRGAHLHYKHRWPELYEIHWRTVTTDEAHLAAIGNDKSLINRGLCALTEDKRILSTGTPFGGDYLRVYSYLTYLRPDLYRSKWHYAERWLNVEKTPFGKNIHNELKEGVEDEYWKALSPVLLRRTKAEVAPWLPPIQIIPVWCDMTTTQRDQYESFAADSYLRFENGELFGKAKLDEYTRLRQLATAFCELKDGKLIPTDDSGKLEYVWQDLTELGIPQRKGKNQVVIYSQFTTVLTMMDTWLEERKVPTATISGPVSDKRREKIQDAFQAGEGPRVLLVSVKAGGTSIELDRADDAMFMDETNNPDHCEQAENRLHRASHIHQVTCRYYRSSQSIEEELFDDVTQRQAVNLEILDLRRGLHVRT